MKKLLIAAAAVAPLVSFAGLYGDIPDAKHAWSVHDWNRPKPAKVMPADKCGGAPSDAIVLFDGTRASLDANWQDEKGNPTKWEIKNGGFTSKPGWGLGSIRTKAEFGDCQLHIEYRHNPDNVELGQGPQMRGNSGVFLMGFQYGYEIQVLESYNTSKEMEGKPGYVDNYADGQAGSVYAENPPLVNPARKCGEWQVYDIVFHQPRWVDGKLVHPGSVTVLFNGVLVQDHWEMEGQTTHCRRRPLAEHPTTGFLGLQDHGCEVTFRNIWIRPLASRWDNLTHSEMSADPNEVMKLRRETAAKLFAKIADPKSVNAETVKALAEVVAYANEGEYQTSFANALKAYREMKPTNEKEVKSVNDALKVLVRGGILKDADLIK